MSNPNLRMSLSCPMPKLDFDIITLGHGSGGLLTNQLLDKVILDVLQNPILDKRHDGAFLEMNGPMAFTTDSFVISPIFFPGGNIGDLAIHGTVNDLAMSGATPQYISLAFIIEEGLNMEELWEILHSIKHATQQAGVKVVTGDTKVVERGKGDKIFINTSGIGAIHPKAKIDATRIQKGDKVILSGPIATHGIAIMSQREGLQFGTSLTSDSQPLNAATLALIEEFDEHIKFFRDPTRGGVASSLNEVASSQKIGIDLKGHKIPMLDEVRGGCELLGLDPLYVANEGVFIAIVAGSKGEEVEDFLKNIDGFEQASLVGEVVEEHPSQVILHSGIGGKRVVHMLVGEQLPRIC
ncbi:MAG: hydrogenase expression/formation protein HypE [Bacteroidia bacterium]|nr:hydrogenase expression/formation protein HypE [Bacteroidia bacterium]